MASGSSAARIWLFNKGIQEELSLANPRLRQRSQSSGVVNRKFDAPSSKSDCFSIAVGIDARIDSGSGEPVGASASAVAVEPAMLCRSAVGKLAVTGQVIPRHTKKILGGKK